MPTTPVPPPGPAASRPPGPSGDSEPGGVLLSPRGCVIAAVLSIVVLASLPGLGERLEPLTPAADYRIPYVLSEDYWHVARWARHVAERGLVPVFGDSVVWGEYTAPGGTLSRHLDRRLGEPRFANLGLNGAHPLALLGLYDRHLAALRGRPVILQLNPLWLASPVRDLAKEGPDPVSHPRLLPQLWPLLPGYRATLSDRLGAALGERLPARSWARHLTLAYFDGEDLSRWTVHHPGASPLASLGAGLPRPDPAPEARHRAIDWRTAGSPPVSLEWVAPEGSHQWRAFRRLVERLLRDGSPLFVLVGPFNRHMLVAESRPGLDRVREAAGDWLGARGVPHHIATPLPSELYGDASHPLDAGYATLARRLLQTPGFRGFLESTRREPTPEG